MSPAKSPSLWLGEYYLVSLLLFGFPVSTMDRRYLCIMVEIVVLTVAKSLISSDVTPAMLSAVLEAELLLKFDEDNCMSIPTPLPGPCLVTDWEVSEFVLYQQ